MPLSRGSGCLTPDGLAFPGAVSRCFEDFVPYPGLCVSRLVSHALHVGRCLGFPGSRQHTDQGAERRGAFGATPRACDRSKAVPIRVSQELGRPRTPSSISPVTCAAMRACQPAPASDHARGCHGWVSCTKIGWTDRPLARCLRHRPRGSDGLCYKKMNAERLYTGALFLGIYIWSNDRAAPSG